MSSHEQQITSSSTNSLEHKTQTSYEGWYFEINFEVSISIKT